MSTGLRVPPPLQMSVSTSEMSPTSPVIALVIEMAVNRVSVATMSSGRQLLPVREHLVGVRRAEVEPPRAPRWLACVEGVVE